MANKEHLAILKQGVEVWNRWMRRKENPNSLDWIVYASTTLSLIICILLSLFLVRNYIGGPREFLKWVYASSVEIGLICLVALVLFAELPIQFDKRPFTILPNGAARWEQFIFGSCLGTIGYLTLAIGLGAFIILPIITPIRVLISYSLSPEATVISAVAALPILWVAVGALFCYVYAGITRLELGDLKEGERVLFTGHGPLYRDLIAAFKFSLGVLVKGSVTSVRAHGRCEWVALAETIVGRLLEIVAVSIGIAFVLKRVFPGS